jgi:hypothetical protein
MLKDEFDALSMKERESLDQLTKRILVMSI